MARQTLYELYDDLQRAIEGSVDPETGEISDEGLEALAKVEMAFEEKALNVAAYVLSLRMKADGFKGEAQSVESHATALKRRAMAYENQAQRLSEYLQQHLEDGQKLEDERVRISWGTSTGLVLKMAPEEMPSRFVRTRPPEADKKAIADAIKAGDQEAMACGYLDKRRHLRIK